LFCHVERRLSGVILDSPQTALEAVQRTHFPYNPPFGVRPSQRRMKI